MGATQPGNVDPKLAYQPLYGNGGYGYITR